MVIEREKLRMRENRRARPGREVGAGASATKKSWWAYGKALPSSRILSNFGRSQATTQLNFNGSALLVGAVTAI